MGYGMDVGKFGYVLLGGIAASYAGDAPVNNEVQIEETSNTLILQFATPYHLEVVDFGVIVTEDFAAQTDAVVTLQKASTVGGGETVLKNLTLGSGNTLLTKGNGDHNVTVKYPKDNQTAISADTDLDTGDVIHADLNEVADRHLWPGEVLQIQHTTAAGGSGGAYVPFVLVKLDGPDFTQNNVWRELVDGEEVGD